MKEFLSRNRIAYRSRDIFSDPEAKAEWGTLGLGAVPCVVRGNEHVEVLHLDQLRAFLKLRSAEPLASYRELTGAMNRILGAVEKAVRRVPTERLSDPTPNRGRDLKELVFNIHDRVPPMASALDSGVYSWQHGDDYGRSRRFNSTAELADFCSGVRAAWIDRAGSVDDDAAYEMVQTRRGPVTHLQLLESQAFHAAQHLRQIYVFIRQIAIVPVGELTAAEMAPITLGEQVF